MSEVKHTPSARIQRYLNARRMKPMPQLGDCIHGVNTGTPFEGELLLSDLEALWIQHNDMLAALRNAEELLAQTLLWKEGWECSEDELLGSIRAAIAKAEGRQ